MTPIFEACLSHVLKSEGGYSNHPADRGGPTNFGITQEVLASYRGRPASPDDVKNLTRDEAAKIYELRYWNVMNLHRIRSKKIALILFDQGVNGGPATAIKMLQTVLNESFGERLAVDGILGNKTDVAVATAPEAQLCRKLIRAAQLRYADICVKNPTQLVFLKGWLNRTYALQDAVEATGLPPSLTAHGALST